MNSNENKYVSKDSFEDDLKFQLSVSAEAIKKLCGCGVKETSELRLEFFFYTNSITKAEKLNDKLVNMGYASEYRLSVCEEDIYLITGWTSEITMSEKTLLAWIDSMCRIGYAMDCDFNGWGVPTPGAAK